MVGVLWGTWHLPIAFWGSRSLAGDASPTRFVAGFLVFYFVALPAFRVLLVRLHDRTASLLPVMLMHAMLSASTIVMQPAPEAGPVAWNAALGVVLWALVALIAATGGWSGARVPRPPFSPPPWDELRSGRAP